LNISVQFNLVDKVPILTSDEECVCPLVVGNTIQHVVSFVIAAPVKVLVFQKLLLDLK
jgi:hypothetical protein